MDENTNIPNDVNTPTDTSTVADSSSVQQTPVAEAQQTDTSANSADGAQATGDKNVPYERFKEVNDNFRQTQAELKALRESQQQMQQTLQGRVNPKAQEAPEIAAAKQQLAGLIKELAPELGFVSKQEQQQQEAVRAVDQTHATLEAKYNGKDGLPKYDRNAVLNRALEMGMTSAKGLELAYKDMHEAEIMNARIAKALEQTRGVNSEKSNGTGSANAGVSNDDLMKAAQAGDKNASLLLIKRRISGK